MRIFVACLLGVLLLAGLAAVTLPFVRGIAWASVIVISTWPIFIRLRAKMSNRTMASLSMCLGLLAVCLVALVPVSLKLSQEASTGMAAEGAGSPESVIASLAGKAGSLPYIGPRLESWINRELKNGDGFRDLAVEHQRQILTTLSSAVGGAFGALLVFLETIVFTFFFYRDGEGLVGEMKRAGRRLFGPPSDKLFETSINVLRGSVLGVLVTAIAQGMLAGVGYAVAGAPFAVLLGILTMVLALVPFGAPLVYVPVSILLLFNSSSWYAGVGLLVWGIGVVSTSDNVLRPLFISRAVQMSLFWTIIGVIGGLISMGLIGVFAGPLVIALAKELWPVVTGGSTETAKQQ